MAAKVKFGGNVVIYGYRGASGVYGAYTATPARACVYRVANANNVARVKVAMV